MTKEGTHVAFPVMTLALRGSPSANKLWVLVGGGGGPSKTGIPNELVLLQVDTATRKVTELCKHKTGDTIVQSLAVHPTADLVVACALDKTCTLFKVDPSRPTTFEQHASVQANFDESKDGYIKALAFAPSGKLIGSAGTDGKAHLFDASSFDKLPLLHSLQPPGNRSELSDVAFSSNSGLVAVASSSNIFVWSTNEATLIYTIPVASTGLPSAPSFRSLEFYPTASGAGLIASLNSKDRKNSWLAQWASDEGKESKLELKKSVKVASKPLSSVHVTTVDGIDMVSFGCSDGSVGAAQLRSLQHIFLKKEIHSLPVTATGLFSTTDDHEVFIVSSSPDRSIQLTPVTFSTGMLLTVINIIVLILAILIGLYLVQNAVL